MNYLSRTALIMITCSPMAALALGVGGAGVNVGTHTNVAAGGGSGLLGTGINTDANVNTNVTTNSNIDADAAVNSNAVVHERVMDSMQAGGAGHVDAHGATATDLSDQQRKKRGRNLRALKSSSTTDIDNNLSTTSGPLGASTKSNIGLGVESRMPGAAGR